MQAICRLLGFSVQAYHKKQKRTLHHLAEEQIIITQIDAIRKHQPRCGGRKLFIMLQPFFKQHYIVMGRDKFFLLLRKNKLLVRKTKRCVYTTNSKHFFYRYPNMTKDFTALKAHELWVADITFIPLTNRFAYLFLITDAYSRKIIGHYVSDDMKVSSAIIALRKAIDQKPADRIVIHHSDRGMQYCSTAYVQLLLDHHAHISMTQNGDPYENAIAERVNGILKSELLSPCYETVDQAAAHINRSILIYNYKRSHSSLNWQIPGNVHKQHGPQIKRWKNYYQPLKKKEVRMQEP